MADDDRAIFDSATAPEESFEPPSRLIDDRGPEDHAVSDAIDTINRQGPTSRARTTPAATPPAPGGAQPGQDLELDDRSLGGVMQALFRERDRRQEEQRARQETEQRLRRFEEQERERSRAAEAARTPLSQRLFEDPDGVITEIRQGLEEQFRAEIAKTRVTTDFEIASMRHSEIWNDAWQAWYGHVSQGTDPATYFGVMNAPSPGEAIIAWYGEQAWVQERQAGESPAAYRQRVIDEYLAGGGSSPRQAAAAARERDESGRFTPRPQAPRLPTATSRMGATNGAGLAGPPEDGSEEAIFAAGRPEARAR